MPHRAITGSYAGIEEAIATTEGTSFDLDSLVVSELEMDQRPEALYGLGNLRDVLARNEVFLPDAKVEATHSSEFQYAHAWNEEASHHCQPGVLRHPRRGC